MLLNLTLSNSLWFKLDEDNKSIIDGHLAAIGNFSCHWKKFCGQSINEELNM